MVRDRQTLPTLIPLSRCSDLKEFEKVLDRAQNKFFKVFEPSGYFLLSVYAMNLRNELLHKKKEKADGARWEEIRFVMKRKSSELSRQISKEIEETKRRRDEALDSDETGNIDKEYGSTDHGVKQIETLLTLLGLSQIEQEQSEHPNRGRHKRHDILI